MSATGQGQAGGDAGQAQQGEAVNGNGGAEGGADLAQALEILQQQGAGQEEMRQQLTQMAHFFQNQQQQDDPGEPDPEPLDLSFLDASEPGYDPDFASQRLEQILAERDQRNEERWRQQYVDPLRNDLSDLRLSQGMQDLAAEFPDIAENADGFIDLVNQAADAMGMPDARNNVQFMRFVRLAAAGAEAANTENGAESPQAAHLEGGGGATPAGGSQVDLGDQIISAQPKRVLPFG